MTKTHLIKPEAISEVFIANDYLIVHETQKKRAFQRAGNPPVYVNLTSTEGVSAVVLHPDQIERRDLFDAIEGVTVGATIYHSSNLRLFPKRQHTGKNEIAYGIPVEFASETALRNFLRVYEGQQLQTGESEAAVADDAPTSYETTAEVRIGQDAFRDQLLRYWRGCAVTGIECTPLLRASHIKPWRNASDAERRDHYNGLLLAAHLDAAFDQGLISFDDAGYMLLSPRLSATDRSRLHFDSPLRLRTVDSRHKVYLAYHRTNVFKA